MQLLFGELYRTNRAIGRGHTDLSNRDFSRNSLEGEGGQLKGVGHTLDPFNVQGHECILKRYRITLCYSYANMDVGC